jgi:hypothetical protein
MGDGTIIEQQTMDLQVAGERTEIGSTAHADWTRGGSRILQGKRGVLGLLGGEGGLRLLTSYWPG